MRRLALILLAGAAQAQTPAEAPPAGWSAPVYVDSAGCVFHRAELGGDIIWAQRLGPDGAPLCGQPPSVQPSLSDALPAIPPSRAGAVPDFPEPGIYLQLGAFSAGGTADRVAADLQAQGYRLWRQDFPRLRVLFAGPFADEATAAEARRALRGRGFPDAFLRQSE
ncbi:SPOR domain-containing protein [Meridianimarinicoccus sp. RP-17]|uniref:SPOR domain-containing protein n=1 Tax=Meridianimarinicoccus zhengii TaxID=2056810 RepID=UPI000DAD6251|nr:SPOR domain-containing protein [Phycocomes zhengii]